MAEYLKLKKSNCKNCYRCIRCCPVKSIRFSGGQANIIGNECILCGQCFVNCPQDAKEITSSIETVKVLLASKQQVIVSLAPSFLANYEGVGIESMEKSLQQLGFFKVEETAIGATLVKDEYQQLIDRDGKDIVITSSCHSINLLIQKYYPNLLKHLAQVVSPMQAHAMDIKKRYPKAKVVFIGPCIAKKDEASFYEGIVDEALTFEDLSKWLSSQQIELQESKDEQICMQSRARFFPTTGGILKTITNKNPEYTYFAIDGVDSCMKVLDDINKGKIEKCFIEMSACVGSCIGGPVMEKYRNAPLSNYITVEKNAGELDFEVEKLSDMSKTFTPIALRNRNPLENEIINILKQIGKHTLEDELDCGSCGYATCREKAKAVYFGKADMTMCLPFLSDKAETFSDMIVNNSINGILVLNDKLEIQRINKAALHIFNLRKEADVMGEQVVKIIEPMDFMNVQASGKSIKNKSVYLAEYDRYVEQTIIYDSIYKMLVCILRDVSEEKIELAKKEELARKTIETTDKVIQKQMRVVHEIASLLGETAAETKVALTKLKESLNDD